MPSGRDEDAGGAEFHARGPGRHYDNNGRAVDLGTGGSMNVALGGGRLCQYVGDVSVLLSPAWPWDTSRRRSRAAWVADHSLHHDYLEQHGANEMSAYPTHSESVRQYACAMGRSIEDECGPTIAALDAL